MKLIKNSKKNWIGHVLRGEGQVRQVLEWWMEEKSSTKRSRTGTLDELIVNAYGDTKRMAENRNELKN